MARRVLWIDAFTDRPMGGNPCAVVFDAADVPTDQRIAFTAETRLSECAFLVGSDRADFGARYYLATREILFAGHPTIATCAALEAAGLLAGRTEFTLEVGAGVVPIAVIRGDGPTRFVMTQAAPEFLETRGAEEIAVIYGLAPEEILGTPQIVSTGTPFCITLLRDREALRRARLDHERLAAFQASSTHPQAAIMEPFLVTLGGATAEGDTFSRLLLAPPLPPEDPYTGSATGCMAAYLWHHGLIERPIFTAEQGHWMGRPGRGYVEVLGPRDAIRGVRLGGSGVALMDGALHL